MKLITSAQSVGVARDVSYTCLGVLLQLTKHEFHICSFLNTSTHEIRILNLVKCKSYRAVSATPHPHNFLIYACAILLPWLQRLRNWEVINRSITSNITHSNNIVTGYM